MTDKNTIRIHDSSFGVWWTAVDEDRMKKEVYGPIIRHLRDRGWKIGEDPQIKKNYPKLNRTHRYGRLGNLEMEMRICGRCVEVEFFQNVANVENRNGGRYDFHKLDRMPYLLHLKTIATLRSLTRLLTTSGDYVIQDKEEPHKAMRKTKITAMECLKARYAECCHTKPELGRPDWHADYNRKSAEGALLEHGQTVWITDRKGRWLRSTAYYNLNNMWWVVTGPYSIENHSCGDLHTVKPTNLRQKDNARLRRKRLEEEMSRAIQTMNFARAAKLKAILFGDQPLFRIRKEGAWYRPVSAGYTTDTTEAGLFLREEAERETRGHDELKMVPVAA
jgi:hypothetical protein